jgi:hypothetical protein
MKSLAEHTKTDKMQKNKSTLFSKPNENNNNSFFFQPKLTINQPNDPYEQEADSVAEKVMRMPMPTNKRTFFTPKPVLISGLQRKCAECEEEERKVQMKANPVIVQRQETESSAGSPNLTLPIPSLLQPSTGPDFLAMRRPFIDRNIFHLWDPNSTLRVWQFNFDFFRRFGLSPDLSSTLSNFTAPRAIDAQLKANNPTWWNITDRELNTTTFEASIPILEFSPNFSPVAPTWFRSIFHKGGRTIQRKCAECEEDEKLRRKEKGSGETHASNELESYIGSINSSGTQLPNGVRSFFEPRFGYDFSNVRVHKDSAAAKSAQSVKALAYTSGNNIIFNQNQYSPNTDAGKKLLAHELTHVMQQSNTRLTKSVQRFAEEKDSSLVGETIPRSSNRLQLSYGSQGPDVIYLQRRLNLFGANLVEDGIFGPLTNQAVKQFQAVHAPPVDGIVGTITWGALENDPATPGQKFVSSGQANATNSTFNGAVVSNFVPGLVAQITPPPLLVNMPVGPFANFVNTNLIDHSIAALLNDLLIRFPTAPFATDAANFALQELGNGNLVGMVLDTQVGQLLPRLPASQHNTINNIQANGLNNPGEYHQFFSQGIIRGFIVMDDVQMNNAQLPGPTRDLTQLMLVHELNHHRNRNNAQILIGQPITSQEYVDVPLALQRRQPLQTRDVRELFIMELTARHVAYLVEQERFSSLGQPTQPLQSGQFFNAAIDFARNDPNAYHDNGYMATLAARNPDDDFRRQVAIWMHNLRNQQFHSDPQQNAQLQLFIRVEFTLAQARNFTQTPNGSNGMA